jgi:hypothetical protein
VTTYRVKYKSTLFWDVIASLAGIFGGGMVAALWIYLRGGERALSRGLAASFEGLVVLLVAWVAISWLLAVLLRHFFRIRTRWFG